jgi:hypothetical protein
MGRKNNRTSVWLLASSSVLPFVSGKKKYMIGTQQALKTAKMLGVGVAIKSANFSLGQQRAWLAIHVVFPSKITYARWRHLDDAVVREPVARR